MSSSGMKKNDFLGIRLPKQMSAALERERKKMSRAAGAEVKLSAAARAMLELGLETQRRNEKARAA